MKIFHFVYNLSSYSGAAQQALKISRFMPLEEVFFINFDDKTTKMSSFRNEDYNVIYNVPNSFVVKTFWLIFLYFRLKPNICHFHGFHRLPILLFSRIFRCSSILKCTLLGKDDLASLLSGENKAINKFLISNLNVINSLNRVIYDINVKYFPEEKMVTIPNGVELSKTLTGNEIRKDYLCSGAVVPRKNVLEVIKYFNQHFFSSGETLYIAGPNTPGLAEFDPLYYQECIRESNENVVFLGNVGKKEINRLYQTSKALIFFSQREGTPNVVLESLSNNCPVIHSGNDLVINDILCEEAIDLINVNYLLRHEKVKLKVVAGIYSKLVEQYSIESTSQLHIKLYKRLLR